MCNDAAGRSYICATLLIVSSFIRSATITTTATEAAADRAKATRRMVFVRLRLLSSGAGAAALLSSRRSAILSHNPSGTVALSSRWRKHRRRHYCWQKPHRYLRILHIAPYARLQPTICRQERLLTRPTQRPTRAALHQECAKAATPTNRTTNLRLRRMP